METKWEQESKNMDKNGNKVGARNQKWDKNGNKVRARNQKLDKNPKMAEWGKSGTRMGTKHEKEPKKWDKKSKNPKAG